MGVDEDGDVESTEEDVVDEERGWGEWEGENKREMEGRQEVNGR